MEDLLAKEHTLPEVSVDVSGFPHEMFFLLFLCRKNLNEFY
jgi:hypothetical protein